MGLVGYSDSEESDAEVDRPVSKPTIAAKPTAKPAFQKLVDKANPGKIQVRLPTSTVSTAQKDGDDIDAPPAKRAKKASGLSGFNAMLPAPKKAAPPSAGATAASKRGLGVGVGLKTSGQAAFSREPAEPSTSYDEYGTATGASNGDARGGNATPDEQNRPEVKLVGRSTVFKPLSVANKKGKKRKTVAELAAAVVPSASSAPARQGVATIPLVATQNPVKTKVSLFSLGTEDVQLPPQGSDLAEHDGDEEEPEEPEDAFWPGTSTQQSSAPTDRDRNGGREVDVTSDLNLTAAERRQLFGRLGKGDIAAMNIINFNTDEEYARNGALRASGEADATAQQHRGVKAIAPGKHSLKQLVNAAVSQKDVLEDSFAQGRKNKKEAGNKYGW